MKTARNQQALATRVCTANRVHGALQSTIIMAVALGATVLVGLTGFSA
ncbi:MAG: hypothetical protein ABJM29_02565 [Rhizobiaceae bacterium]